MALIGGFTMSESSQQNLLLWSKNLVLSGDKFNAMAGAVNFVLEKIEGLKDSKVRMAYKDVDPFGSFSFVHFELVPGIRDGVPFVELGGETQLINHFSSSDTPALSRSGQAVGTRIDLHEDCLEIIVCDYQDVVAWIRFEDSRALPDQEHKFSLVEDFVQLLGVTLRNITNDFQLLLTKKQIEKQKRDLEKSQKQISRQNQIFRALMETMARFHQADMKAMVLTVLEKLGEIFLDRGFGMIIQGERPEIMDRADFIRIDSELQDRIVQAAIHNPKSDEKDVFRFYPLSGLERPVLGKLVQTGTSLTEEDEGIIRLFIDQVASFMENKILMKELERLASTDGLTGAYSRSFFDKELEQAIENSRKFRNLHFSLFVVDLNGLKRINDVFGHQRGDAMLIRSAEALLKCSRKSDIVSRLGGDEFILLAPATSLEQANPLLDRIREVEAKLRVVCRDSSGNLEEIPIRFSIGIASTSEGISPEEVMQKADERMYQDKEAFYQNEKRYR